MTTAVWAGARVARLSLQVTAALGAALLLGAGACGDSGAGTGDATGDLTGGETGDDPDATVGGEDGSTTGATDVVEPRAGDDVDDAGGAGTGGDLDAEAGDAGPIDEEPGLWASLPIGDDGVLASIAAVSAGEVYAVGGDRVLRYNGATWVVYGQPFMGTDDALHGVWADADQVVIVGDGGFIARRLTGQLTWTVEQTDVASLRAVAGRSGDDLWAVGDSGTLLHYEGADTGWVSQLEGSNIDLYAVWVDLATTGSDGVLAVGSQGTLVSWKGAAWAHQQIAQNNVLLHAVIGAGDVRAAVGTEGTIAVRPGLDQGWKGETSSLPETNAPDLMALVATSSAGIYALGEKGSIALREGNVWNKQSVTGPVQAGADIVAAANADGTLIALGATGDGLVLDGEEWVDLTTRATEGLAALAVDADGVRWAVGPAGLLLTETQDGWTAIPTGTQEDLRDVTVAADGSLWAVGEGGTILSWTDEAGLELLDAPLPTDLFCVIEHDDVLVIGGKGGTLLRSSEGGPLLPWPSGITQDVRDLTIAGDGSLWLSGAFGKLGTMPSGGDTLSDVPTGVGGNLNAVAPLPDGVLAVGDNGVILRATGAGASATVETLNEEPGLFLYGAAALDGTTLAVGWNGSVLLATSGDTFEAEDSGVHVLLEDVLLTEGLPVTVVGRTGVILERTEAP